MCVRTIVLICFVVHTAASVSINLLHPASDHVLVAGQPLAVKALVSGLSSSFKVFVRVSYCDEMRQLALRLADTGLWIGDVSDLVGRCTPTGFPLTLRAVALSDSCNVPPDSSTMGTCSDAAAQEFTSSPICVHVVCGSSAHSCDSNRSCVADQPLHDEGCGGFINSVTNTGAPYISVVLSGRNDEAMGDFTGRVQAFIDHFSIAAWAMNMSAEIIVVEWNPPAARSALASVLKSGAPHNRLPVFIASVSPALHARLSKASSTEFFEYAAKNVGIRLARGSWILVGNPDSLFTLPMLTFLSLRRLTPGHFYRAHRDNIGRGQWPSIGSRPWLQQPFGRLAQLEARSQFSLHWSSMEGGRQLVSDSSVGTCSFGHVPSSRQLLHAAQSTDQPYAVAPGDFLIADSSTWNALGAYPDIINTAFLDYLQPCRMVGAGLKEVKDNHHRPNRQSLQCNLKFTPASLSNRVSSATSGRHRASLHAAAHAAPRTLGENAPCVEGPDWRRSCGSR